MPRLPTQGAARGHGVWRSRPVLAAIFTLVLAAVTGCRSTASTQPHTETTIVATPVQTGFVFRTIRVQGRDYPYAIFVPRDYDASRRWPMLVFLHGRGECGTDGSKPLAQGVGTAIMLEPQRWPMLVVFPQKPTPQSAWEDHDEAVVAMMDEARREFNIDERRLYLSGLSQGGHGTWAIAANHPDTWAAIAPICGYGDPAVIAPKVKDIPTWCFHGDADNVVPVKQTLDMAAAIRTAGGDPRVSIFPGVNHGSWDRAYRDEGLAAWLLEHRRHERRSAGDITGR